MQKAPVVVYLALAWAGVVLAFLLGVRRGLGFRTQGGPTMSQMFGIPWLFALALAALVSPWPVLSCLLLLAGFISLSILDSIAVQRGEAPSFSATLRPPQMAPAAVSLLMIGTRLTFGGMP